MESLGGRSLVETLRRLSPLAVAPGDQGRRRGRDRLRRPFLSVRLRELQLGRRAEAQHLCERRQETLVPDGVEDLEHVLAGHFPPLPGDGQDLVQEPRALFVRLSLPGLETFDQDVQIPYVAQGV